MLLLMLLSTLALAAPQKVAFLGAFSSPKASDQVTDANLEKGANTFFALHPEASRMIELVKYDNLGDAEETVKKLQEIEAAGIKIIVGLSKSNQAMVVSPIAQKKGFLFLSSLATNDKVTRGFSNVFRICYSDTSQGEALGGFAVRELKSKRVLVLTNVDQIFSVGLSRTFLEQVEGKIDAAEIQYVTNDMGMEKIKSKLAAYKPDLVLVTDYVNRAAPLIKALHALDPKLTFLGGDGLGGTTILDGFLRNLKGLTLYYSGPYSPQVKTVRNKAFVAQFLKLYPGDAAGNGSALMYDTLSVLWAAMGKGSPPHSPESLKKALLASSFETTTGPIFFPNPEDPTPKRKVVVIRYQSMAGKHELYRVY